jgi:lysophospholipase
MSETEIMHQCALAKLAYLLSKSDLTVARVRELVSVPLRGELTLPTPLTRPTTTALDSVQDLLSEILRLSQPAGVSGVSGSVHVDSSGTAPWSATASHANATELSLLPYLMHLAVARNDPASVSAAASHPRHPSSHSAPSAQGTPTTEQPHQFAQGAPNAPLPGSLHTPLHTAALQGSAQCTRALLEVGALVHVRDALDHTCLFYAARVRAREVVEMLVGAGAHLGETDRRVARGIMSVGVGGRGEGEIWKLAGLELDES